MSFGSRLRERREILDLKQSDLGKLLGITGAAIGNYENDISTPKADILYRLFDALQCDANYLFQDEMKALKTDDFTVPEIRMIRKYRDLDAHGKEMVDSVLEIEYKRSNQPPADEADEKIVRFTVPQYQEPMSAGYGDDIGTAYAENIELIKEPPRGTSFIARVNGDSMEPDFHSGDWVFVHAQNEIRVGQVGVFWMNGEEFIKELGEGELISRNQDYAPRAIEGEVRCQGLVLGICDDSYFEQ